MLQRSRPGGDLETRKPRSRWGHEPDCRYGHLAPTAPGKIACLASEISRCDVVDKFSGSGHELAPGRRGDVHSDE